MTVTSGDLPDWQTLVTPQVNPAGILNQGANTNGILFQSTSPFRIWGFWLSVALTSNSSYAGGFIHIPTYIADLAGDVYLACWTALALPSQFDTNSVAIAAPGVTPSFDGVHYTAILSTGIAVTNVDYDASGGIYYSQP